MRQSRRFTVPGYFWQRSPRDTWAKPTRWQYRQGIGSLGLKVQTVSFPTISPRHSAAGYARTSAALPTRFIQYRPWHASLSLIGISQLWRAAEACAARICKLQGIAGQWWWHYDTRNGSIVEGYPVYSVHQHAMAPMALLDLREAGGADHSDAVARGLGWLEEHPEVSVPLVSHENNVIWRKAARREPKKAVRAISAMTTALRPGLLLPGLDAIFPPCEVDYECRPYELGWLLYAWLSGGALTKLRDRPRT